MLRLGTGVLHPCHRCKLHWIFPLGNKSPQHLEPSQNKEKCLWGVLRTRCHSSLSDPQIGYVPSSSSNDVSLEDTVSQSRQGCDTEEASSQKGSSRSVRRAKSALRKWEKYRVPWVKPEGYDTGIMIANSLTRQKEPLILPKGKIATWYCCGPTVYDSAHIGHARTYLMTDVMRRVMTQMFGIDVVLVMGITDIDDKIIRRANEADMDYQVMAKRYEHDFFRDMDSLNILPPTIKTLVTDHIPHIINFIQRIMDKGYAYRTPSGTVCFDITRYGKPGKLLAEDWDYESKSTVCEGEKKHKADFTLWKPCKPGEPYWDSPWGPGRPGWHIECSAMSSAVCGEKLDIHSGGEDLKFPHHQNEIYQSESCFDCDQWSNYWVHMGRLHLAAEPYKMSKSRFNTVEVTELLEQYTANQFRLFCLMKPYKKRIDFDESTMYSAMALTKRWQSFLAQANGYVHGQVTSAPVDDPLLMQCLEETRLNVRNALADNFDTERVIALLDNLIKQSNKQMDRRESTAAHFGVRNVATIGAVVQYFEDITTMLGLQLNTKKSAGNSVVQQRFEDVMNTLVKYRNDMRRFAKEANKHLITDTDVAKMTEDKKKKIAMKKVQPILESSDELRQNLRNIDINIMDHKEGATWEVRETKMPTKQKGSVKSTEDSAVDE